MAKKIMVIDDNPDVALSVKRGLEDLDKEYNVIGTESGEECLELLKNN